MTTAAVSPRWCEAVEQARARGLTVEQTSIELGIDPRKVVAVWRRMDAANDEDAPRVLGAASTNRVCARTARRGR